MIDMKVDKKTAEKETPEAMEKVEAMYPNGLQLRMDNDELEKLGIDVNKVEIGEEVHIEAVAKITSISKYETENVGSMNGVSYQITEIEIRTDTGEDKQAKGIYKKG